MLYSITDCTKIPAPVFDNKENTHISINITMWVFSEISKVLIDFYQETPNMRNLVFPVNIKEKNQKVGNDLRANTEKW